MAAEKFTNAGNVYLSFQTTYQLNIYKINNNLTTLNSARERSQHSDRVHFRLITTRYPERRAVWDGPGSILYPVAATSTRSETSLLHRDDIIEHR